MAVAMKSRHKKAASAIEIECCDIGGNSVTARAVMRLGVESPRPAVQCSAVQ